MNELNIFSDESELIPELAGHIINLISRNADAGRDFYLAVSGGNTPRKLFSRLADESSRIPCLEKLQLFWVDERCVPPDHEQSNYRMTYESLISRIPIAENQVHRIKGEEEPEREADRYGRLIDAIIPVNVSGPVFDLILLGMGADGHTASIFPDNLDLFISQKNCEPAIHPQTLQKRISLTGRILNNARHLIFLVTGSDKAEMLRDVLQKEGGRIYPASLVDPVHGRLEWFLDKAAAGKLGGK